jgi:hypothetical protein
MRVNFSSCILLYHILHKLDIIWPVKKTEIMVIGIRHADHATPPYPPKLALTSSTSGGCSFGIVR